MKIDSPGVYSGIPMEVYLTDPVVEPSLSSSIAVTMIQKSPFHAWAEHARNPKRIPRDDSKAADIGTTAHALLLEKSEDSVCVIDPQDHVGPRGGVPKGWTNDSIKVAREAARVNGKTPMLPWDMETCLSMRDAALEYISHSQIAGVFDAGESEATVIAQEGPTWLRCRPDWMTHDKAVVVHFKTTKRSARPEVFSRGLLPSMGYDLALAFYARAIASATGTAPELHCILAQEQDPPYACSLIALDSAYAAITERQIQLAITTWTQCLRSNHWPAYSSRIFYAEPKPWQIAEVEQQEIEDFMTEKDPLQAEHGVQI